MNSCLYQCRTMHYRKTPKEHRFVHDYFMFYLDLDDIDHLTAISPWIKHNHRAIYEFRDSDHFEKNDIPIREKVIAYLKTQGVKYEGGKIYMLTNLRTFGYVFNPVSFYYCFKKDGSPYGVIIEIGNTFREVKLFFIGAGKFQDGRYKDQQTKFYYISPFMDLDFILDYNLKLPDDRLEIHIDDLNQGQKFFYASLTGTKKPLTHKNILFETLKFPFVTLKVIFLIHFHAFLLYLKKIPYHKKRNHPELQKDVLRKYHAT